MANENGDYRARFERMEKTLATLIEVQQLQANNIAGLCAAKTSRPGGQD